MIALLCCGLSLSSSGNDGSVCGNQISSPFAGGCIAGGTLVFDRSNTVNGAVDIGSSGATVNSGAAGYVDTINGSGGLTFKGAGTTVLSGNSVSIGSLQVDSGSTLILEGSKMQMATAYANNAGILALGANTTLSIANGLANSGSLYGAGILNGNLNNSGTVSAGSSAIALSLGDIRTPAATSFVQSSAAVPIGSAATVSSTTTLNGNLAQTSNGTLAFGITPTSNTQLAVSGSSVQAGGNLFVQASGMSTGPGNNLRTTYTLLNGTNPNATLSGQFANVWVRGLAAGEVYDLTYVSDPQILISVYPDAYFHNMAQTANEREVGTVLDSTVPSATGSLYNQLNSLYQLPAGQLAAAMNQIDGEIYADAPGILYNAVSDTWAPVYARMGLSATQGGQSPANAPHLWMSGVGNFGGVSGNGNADGYSQRAGGFLVGADNKVFDGLNLGLTAGYVNAGANRNNTGSALSAQMWQVGGYADMNVGDNGHIGLLLGYTQGPVDFSNPSAIGTAAGQTFARIISAEARGSWTVDFGNGHSLTPIISLQTVYDQLGGFTESGLGALSLNVPSQNATMVAARFQTRYDYNWRAWGLDWTASTAIGVREMMNQPDPNLYLNYNGIGGQNFTVKGVQNNSSIGSGLVNAGITTHLNNALNLEIGYRGTYSGSTAINAFQGNVVWKFDEEIKTPSFDSETSAPDSGSKQSADKKAAAGEEDKGRDKLDIRTPGPDMANYPNSAYTLPQGGLYMEITPFNYTPDYATNPATYSSGYFFRYGLLDRVELRLYSNGLEAQGNGSALIGFAPLTFDTKIHIWDEWRQYYIPALGFEAAVQTTWLGSPGLTNGTEPSFSFNFDQSLPWDIDLEYNIGAARYQDPLDLSQEYWDVTFQWALQRDIVEDLAVFINGWYGSSTLPRVSRYTTKTQTVNKPVTVCDSNHRTDTLSNCVAKNTVITQTVSTRVAQNNVSELPNIVGAGMIWTVTDNLALYFNAGAGTNASSPTYNVYTGFAWTP
ncbi:autotransporter outer membrane beta-barrel domain-containing protein [Candidatus Methylospira mobilis]|uniref:autotransporter outer membrane beta-barrel domain-containing protein n=1 Tax=Candidatus Methylospira mobilis TaxID=1808979 RepID=UPI001884C9C7|nr:autotransporter outer membrane beta-barrel domain-containing protein [Candidatus Methylospira mobilis]